MVTAVITGASSGLGKEYINAVIAQYPSVDVFWLVARRKELLKEIAEEHPDKTIAAISLDLAKEESVEIFEKLLKENNPEIKVLVNCAGFAKCGDFFSSNAPHVGVLRHQVLCAGFFQSAPRRAASSWDQSAGCLPRTHGHGFLACGRSAGGQVPAD